MSEARTRLAVMLTGYCRERRISARMLAKQLGVGHATAHRIIVGKSMDAATFMKVLNWVLQGDKHSGAYQ